MPSIAEKRRTFRDLHASGCFAIPNPFDVGSARFLQSLGFKALATTSAGAAWSLGFPDGAVPLGVMLDHVAAIAAACDVPVNADFGNGFADAPEGVAENVGRAVATGVAGLSIEDMSGDPAKPLYNIELAVERIRAARAAIDAAGGDTLLVARSEAYLVRHPEAPKEALRRLERFAEAGADCLYAPGVRDRGEIAVMVRAVAPKPVNVLVGAPVGLSLADLAALGVRRVSVGGALARAAWAAFMAAAREIGAEGTFDTLGRAATYAELEGFFTADARARGLA
jgi:2-methylisocitrate lyase-like PEP mutase family enzyme